MVAAAPVVHAAGPLQDGDIVLPGIGLLWKLGSPSPTPWFGSAAFGGVRDAMEDTQGRIVFLAPPANTNENSLALFRADPATGSLERLLMLPYVVSPGDTLPEGLTGVGSFFALNQSLHIEKTYGVSIDDQANGGVPQVSAGESYAFSIGVGSGAGGVYNPVSIRWLTNRQVAEQGLDVSGVATSQGVAMTADGGTVYYGYNGTVYKAGPELAVDAHFSVAGIGTIDAHLRVTPINDLLYAGPVLDDRNIPNVSATCASVTDGNVPMVGGGFSGLQVGTLGTLGGSLYTTTSYGPSGTPYLFSLAPRGPFLNPFSCLYDPAVKFTSGPPFIQGDSIALAPNKGESSDGSFVLANANDNILLVGPGGAAQVIARAAGIHFGRPFRWHSPAALLAGGASQVQSAGDTSLTALVVRVDSLVRILVTDPLGRRIGVTAADSVVNDFGASGLVSTLGASGWPKLITIVGPAPGDHQVDVAGVGSGPYGVIAYLAENSIGGMKSPITGTIAAGETQQRVLQVLPPLTLNWLPQSTGVGAPGAAAALGFDWVGPLPAANTVHFACHVPEAGAVRLELFDLAGRRVAMLADGARVAGPFTTTWSGHADDGRRLPAGVYLARLSMPGVAAVRRVVLSR